MTPSKVRKRPAGNPAITSATLILPNRTPTRKANAMDRRPTLKRETQLTTIATAKAIIERTGRLISALVSEFDCRGAAQERRPGRSPGFVLVLNSASGGAKETANIFRPFRG